LLFIYLSPSQDKLAWKCYAAIGVSVSPLQQLVYLFRYIMPGVSHKEVLQYSTASLILTNKLRAYDVY
jgi:hypothetical protein